MAVDRGDLKWFYAGWVMLSTLSVPFALYTSIIVIVAGSPQVTEDFLTFMFIPTFGLLTGLLQYVLLRGYLPRLGRWTWWIVVTALGLTLGIVLGFLGSRIWSILSGSSTWGMEIGWMGAAGVWARQLDPFRMLSSVMGPAVGATIGLAQWLVLRKRVPRAGWWILASVVGWALVQPITGAVFDSLLEFLAIGAVPAGVTGLVMWWLLVGLPDHAWEASV
jgi:hypothetical protein